MPANSILIIEDQCWWNFKFGNALFRDIMTTQVMVCYLGILWE